LEDAIKDVTIIKWDNRNHVLPNRKLAILNTLRNRHPELTNVPERSHDSYKPSRSYSGDDQFDGETPFAKLPKIIKDDLKQLGFEVRLDLPKSIAKEKSPSDWDNAPTVKRRAWLNWLEQNGFRFHNYNLSQFQNSSWNELPKEMQGAIQDRLPKMGWTKSLKDSDLK